MSTPSDPHPQDRPAHDPHAAPAEPAYGQPAAPAYGQPAAPGYQDPGYQQQPGYQGQGHPGHGGAPLAPKNGLGIAALILGIVALLGAWIPFIGLGSAVIAIIGLILGVLARGKVKRGEATNGGMALFGIILCVLAIVLAIASTVLGVIGLNEAGTSINEISDCTELPVDEQQACLEDVVPSP